MILFSERKRMDMDYGIQMYSLRDTTEQDMEGSLRAVADMGYKLVEFAGFGGNPAEKVAEWLDTYGLTCHSTHTGHAWVVQDLEGMQVMRTLGRNMAWLLKSIEAGKRAGLEPPVQEDRIMTNFIR